MPMHDEQDKKRTLETMLSRRQSRRLAIQIFFCNEFLHEDILSVAERISETLDQKVNPFCKNLLLKTTKNRDNLIELITNNLRDWDIQRIAVLERVLILLALSELLYFDDIPIEVTLNETLELSKEFISNKSSRFINGILDTVLKKLQNEKRIHKDEKTRIPPKLRNKSKRIKRIPR